MKVVAMKEDVTKVKVSRNRLKWLCCTWTTTWCIPSFFLSCCGKMRSAAVRIAWREKVTLCFLVFLVSASLIFILAGLGKVICPRQNVFSTVEVNAMNDITDATVYAFGRIYKINDVVKGHLNSYSVPSYRFESILGQDVSSMFFKQDQFETYCPGLLIPESTWDPINGRKKNDATNYAHRAVDTSTNSKKLYAERLNSYSIARVAWSQQYIEKFASTTNRLIIIGQNVYDVSAYYNSKVKFLGPLVENLFSNFYGKDGTIAWNQIKVRDSNADLYLDCMNNLFYVGTIDTRDSLRCRLNNYVLLFFTGILTLIIVFKFLAALSCGGTVNPEDNGKFVIVQIPCYTESSESLSNTLDSIARLDYEAQRYLLFIVVDGIVIGQGNDLPTHLILFDILGIDHSQKVERFEFESLGEGDLQINTAQVYSGFYRQTGKEVPFILIVKVGGSTEIIKPGNRGKRDSQLILMRFLSRCHFESALNPLEFEIRSLLYRSFGINPSIYEYVLMVDSDTTVQQKSLKHLISTMTHDSKIMGLCGETLITNDKSSWVTMIQVYEYFISHHLSKSFESMFGSVTCLPGCFCMYRIRSPNKRQPLLIAPRVLNEYSRKNVDTLHMKNLLLLGEDRYLTTLMMKHFPYMKLCFNANAKCHTVVPDQFSVLLSQRRRWINSTVMTV